MVVKEVVCVISGLDLTESELKSLATELKKRCACGGAIKNHCIEIQGDKRPLIKRMPGKKDFKLNLLVAKFFYFIPHFLPYYYKINSIFSYIQSIY